MKKNIVCVLLPLVILNSIVGEEADIITNIRQLTFEGKRSGEGYFGPQGNLIVFQSERDPKNPFYQIYLMNLLNGDIDRISQDTGKKLVAGSTRIRIMYYSPQPIKMLNQKTNKSKN